MLTDSILRIDEESSADEYCLELSNDKPGFVSRGNNRTSKLDSMTTASLTLPNSESNSSSESLSGLDANLQRTPRNEKKRLSFVLHNDIKNLNEYDDPDNVNIAPKRNLSEFSLRAKRNMSMLSSEKLNTLGFENVDVKLPEEDAAKLDYSTQPKSERNSSSGSLSGLDAGILKKLDSTSPRKEKKRLSIVLPNDIKNLNEYDDPDNVDITTKQNLAEFSLRAKRNMSMLSSEKLNTSGFGNVDVKLPEEDAAKLDYDVEAQEIIDDPELPRNKKRVSIAMVAQEYYDDSIEVKPKRKPSVFSRRGIGRLSMLSSVKEPSVSGSEGDYLDENEVDDKPRRKPSIFSLRKKRLSITEPDDVAPYSTAINAFVAGRNDDDSSESDSSDYDSDYQLEINTPNFQEKERIGAVPNKNIGSNNARRRPSGTEVKVSLPSLEKYALRTSCVKFSQRISERKELTTIDRAASKVLQPGRRKQSIICSKETAPPKYACLEGAKINLLKSKDFFYSTVLTGFSNVFWVILVSIAITACVENVFPNSWRDKLEESTAASTVLGVFVTFSLVFRTNLCYNRWWECRVRWGQIVRLCCHLSQQGAAWIRHPAVRDRFMTYCICFPYAAKAVLRGNNFAHEMEEGRYLVRQGLLSADELDDIASENRHPHVCIDMMRALVNRAFEQEDGITVRGEGGRDACLSAIERTIADLAHAMGALNRLKTTGLPGMYNYFVTYNIILFVVFSNLGWSVLMGWYAPVVTGFIVFVMSSLVFVGDRMLDSHGLHVVGLPLQKYCVTVEREVIKVRFRCEKFADKVANL